MHELSYIKGCTAGLGHSSMVQLVLSMHESLGSIPSMKTDGQGEGSSLACLP